MKLIAILSVFFISTAAFAQNGVDISGTIEWDTMQIHAVVSLDLASAGIRLPAGRTHGESILRSEYLRLIQPEILGLRVDSSSTIADLINRGEFSRQEAEMLALSARSVPAALSPDMQRMTSSHTIPLSGINTAFIRHVHPAPVMRTLNPVSTAQYTGIIIIAAESLPVHGMRSRAMAVPSLLPKVWDSDMNLIYEKNMLVSRNTPMVRFAPLQSILQRNPSGLTPELAAVVGEHPMRIFAVGVFGISPTDLIIDRRDAMRIISSDANRSLLAEGRVAIILDESVLRQTF